MKILLVCATLFTSAAYAKKAMPKMSKEEAKEACMAKDSTLQGKKLYKCIKQMMKNGK